MFKLWDNYKRWNICVMQMAEGEKKRKNKYLKI